MTELVASDRAPQLLVARGVVIPDDAVIGANVVIRAGVELGRGVVIEDAVTLGKVPAIDARSTSPEAVQAPTRVGDGAIVGSHTVVSTGAQLGAGSYVGDHALVREGARLGTSAAVGHGCTVSRDVKIGDRTRLQSFVVLGALTIVEEDCFIAPAVVMLVGVTMGSRPMGPSVVRRGARIGSGAQILPGLEIGEDAVVGAGAVVIRDVPAGVTVAGVPARPLSRG